MSSAKPSKRCAVGVVKPIAFRDRRRSVRTGLYEGRYQATTLIPWACAASIIAASVPGRTMSVLWRQFEVSRYSVCTPCAFMRATAPAGSSSVLFE